MKKILYKTYWGLLEDDGIDREGDLYELYLDYPFTYFSYNFNSNELKSLIPTLEVMNQIFKSGGTHGGMSPGTTWKPFTVNEEEYNELVNKLMHLDSKKTKVDHPYCSDEFIIDEELNQESKNAEDWKKKWQLKYRGIDEFNMFSLDNDIPLFYKKKEVGFLSYQGGAKGYKFRAKLVNENDFQDDFFGLRTEAVEDYVFANTKNVICYKASDPNEFEVIDYFGIKRKLEEIICCNKSWIFFRTIFDVEK